jgi:tetratricopeptide (TPR) repeat protein
VAEERRIPRGAGAAVLTLAAVLPYLPLLRVPPFYDDAVFLRSPLSALSPGAFLRVLLSRDYFALSGERSWQPLVTLCQHLCGGSAPALRAGGLLLHAAATLLLAELARRALRSREKAFLAALLFALFPAATELLAVSSFVAHAAAAAAGLAALLCWEASGRSRLSAFLWPPLFVLALLSKESALSVPLAAAAWAACVEREDRPPLLRPALAAGGLVVLYLAVRFLLLRPAPAAPALVAPGWSSLLSLGAYARVLVWPAPLCLERSLPATFSAEGAFLLALGLAALGGAALLRGARRFAALWTLLSLLPVLHFVPFANYSPTADRYLYLPSAGFALLLASLSWRPLLPLLLSLCWGALGLRRAALYGDPGAFLRQTAACAPANPRAQALLGAHLLEREGDAAAALPFFARAFDLDPGLRTRFDDPGWSHVEGRPYVLGLLELRLSRPSRAAELFDAGLREEEDPSARAPLLVRRAEARSALGDRVGALADCAQAERLAPSWHLPPLKSGLLIGRSDRTRAAAFLERARALDPGGIRLPELLEEAYRLLGPAKSVGTGPPPDFAGGFRKTSTPG